MDVSLDYINEVIARSNASKQAGAKEAPASSASGAGMDRIDRQMQAKKERQAAAETEQQKTQKAIQENTKYQKLWALEHGTNGGTDAIAKRRTAAQALRQSMTAQEVDTYDRLASETESRTAGMSEESLPKNAYQLYLQEQEQKKKEFSAEKRKDKYDAVQDYLATDEKAGALWKAEHKLFRNEEEIQQLRSAMSAQEQQVYDAAKQARKEYGGTPYEIGQNIGYLAESAGTGLVSGVANIYNNLIDTDQAARELMARYTLSAAGDEEEAREQNRAWYDEQTKVLRPASQGALPAFDELSPEEQETILQTGPYATVSMKRANAYRQEIAGAEAVRGQDMVGENSLEDLGKLAGTYQQESGKSGAVQMAGNVASAIGGMAPNIAANMAGMPGLGWYSLYAGSAGGAAQQARDAGADTLTAATAGALSGAVEMATEKMFDGIPGMSQGNRFAVSDAVEKGIQKYIKSATGQKVVGKLADVLGEGAEEYVSELAGSYIAQLYQEDNRTFLERASDPDTWYAFAVGSLTSGVMNAGAAAIGAAANRGQQRGDQEAQSNAGVDTALESGTQEGLTQEHPAEEWMATLTQGGERAAQTIAQQAFGKTDEQSVSYVVDYVARRMQQGQNQPYSLQDLVADAARDGMASRQVFTRDLLEAAQQRKNGGREEVEQLDDMPADPLEELVRPVVAETQNAGNTAADNPLNQLLPGGQNAARAAAAPAAVLQQNGQNAAAAQRAADKGMRTDVQAVQRWAQENESFSPAMRSLAAENYQEGANTALYTTAVQNFYDAGRSGVLSYDQAMTLNENRAAALQQDDALKKAWELGRKEATAVQDAPGVGRTAGQVQYEEGTELGARIDDTVLQAAAQKLGVNIRVMQQLTDDAGGEANGRWAAAMGEIALGENTSNAYQTLTHELTHYMGSYNPEGWQRLRSSALQWYAQQGGQQTGQTIAQYGESYGNYAKGADEAARDVLSGVMSTEDGVRNFLQYLSEDTSTTVQDKKSILQTLRDMLDKLIENVRNLLQGGDATRTAAEARKIAEQADQLEARRGMVDSYLQELETARKEAESRSLQSNAKEENRPASRYENVYSLGRDAESERTTVRKEHPQGKMSGAEQVSYQTLKNLPDMQVTSVQSNEAEGKSVQQLIEDGLNSTQRTPGKKNGRVVNSYTGDTIVVTQDGLRHGLLRKGSVQKNGTYIGKIGQIIENAVKINELEPRGKELRSDVYLGACQDENGTMRAIRFIVNMYENGNATLDGDSLQPLQGSLYAHTSKKVGTAPIKGQGIGTNTVAPDRSNTISIPEFLNSVKEAWGDNLAGTVRYELGIDAQETGTDNLKDALRYSRKEGDAQDLVTERRRRRAAETENRKLAQENTRMADQIELLKQETRLSGGHLMDTKAVHAVAVDVVKNANSRYNVGQLERELRGVYESMSRGKVSSVQEAMETLNDLARGVLSQQRRGVNQVREAYKPLLDKVRTADWTVRESSPLYQDLLDLYGDGPNGKTWGNVRKALFGRIDIKKTSESGTSGRIDALFDELAEEWPGIFDRDSATVDNIQRLMDVYDEVRDGAAYDLETGMSEEEQAAYLAQDLYAVYLSMPRRQTYADRNAAKAEDVAEQFRKDKAQAMAQQKAAYEQKLQEQRKWAKDRMAELQNQYRAAQEAHDQELVIKTHNQIVEVRRQAKDTLLRRRAALEMQWSNQRERANVTQQRQRVQKSVQNLHRWLMKPTAQQHVQTKMQGAVLNLLNSLNMNVGREGTGTAARWQETMKDIQLMAKDALAADGGLTDTDAYADFDPDLPEMISELMAGTETLDVQTMNSRQLKQLADVLTSMQTSIRNANKMMSDAQGRTVDEIAQQSAQEMEQEAGTLLKNRYAWVGKAAESRLGNAAGQLLGLDMMDARRYFTSLGETAQKKVYEPIRKGFDKRVWLLAGAQDAFDDIVGETDISQWTGDRAPAQKFELHDGKTIRLTVGQRMELYNLSQRQQAHEHLMQGGFTLVDSQGGKKGKRVNITPTDLAKIVGSLTNEQMQIARKMSDYLSAKDGPAGWGNEVSRQLYGLDKFNERHYWPIKSDSNQTRTNDATDGGTAGFWAIKNQGFTKSLQKHANNSVLVGDAFDTWANHVANMATYNAWSVPLSDAMKWYNWKSGTDVSTKEEIEGIFGKSGKSYFTTLMQDINGMSAKPSTTGLDKFTKEITRNWKVAKVSANLRVAIQQPTAYIRAAAVMNPKYLAEGLAADVTKLRHGMQMAEEHCAIAKWKSWGYFETNLGQSMKTVLTGEQTALDSVREAGTKLAELGDQVTWGTLWNACEAEAGAKGMKSGTEEFNQYCADRLSEIVDKTQVVDSVLHRSHIMRSKNPLAQMSTNFFAEPTKSYSMMAEAWSNVVHGKKGAKKNFARATATYALTALGTAAAASLIDAARVSSDDDRDKDYKERYLENLWENFRDGVNLLNNIPLVKDVLSIAQGYDATRSDMEMFSDAITAIDAVQKAPEGNITPYRLTYQVANALSSLTGIPMSSAVREAKSAYDMITDLQDPLRLDRKMNRAEDDYSYIDLYNQVKAAGGDKDEFKALYQGKTYGEMLGTDKAKAVDSWVQALAKNSGKGGAENKAVLPKHLDNEISYTDSEGAEHKVVLKGPDYLQYAKSLQSAAVNLIDEYMRTAGATSTTEEQAGFVTLAKEYAQETARETVIPGYEAKDWVERVQTLSGGENVAAMIQARQIVNDAEGKKDANGKTISGSKASNAVDQLQQTLSYSAGEAQALYNKLSGSEENTYMKLYEDVQSSSTQVDKLAALYGTGEAATYSGMLQDSGAVKVDNYLQNLSKSQGKEVLPDRAATKFNAGGEEVELSGKQYIDYAQKRTQTAYNILNELIPNAGNYTKEEQAGFVSKVEDYATQIAKADVSDFEPYKWMQEVQQRAGNDSHQLYDLIMAKTLIDSAEGQKGANGKTISGTKKAAALQSMQDAGYSAAMAQQMYQLFK